MAQFPPLWQRIHWSALREWGFWSSREKEVRELNVSSNSWVLNLIVQVNLKRRNLVLQCKSRIVSIITKMHWTELALWSFSDTKSISATVIAWPCMEVIRQCHIISWHRWLIIHYAVYIIQNYIYSWKQLADVTNKICVLAGPCYSFIIIW